MNRPAIIALAVMFLVLITIAAQAAPQCGPRAAVLAQLAGKYGETRHAIGVAANNMVMELFASAKGSWTVSATSPDGSTCLVASGEGFEAISEALPPMGEPG